MAQGFGGTSGIGILLDESGNDSYFAGGKYPCGWLPNHYFTLSQGFGYGMRPFAGGGIGILCDLKGNNHYVADVYGQGASYWYSTGLAAGPGRQRHLRRVSILPGRGHPPEQRRIDRLGRKRYLYRTATFAKARPTIMRSAFSSTARGNNKYSGDTTAQGAAINNSFAMLLDCSGNDVYTGTDPKQSQAAGHDGDKREYGSIALMLDLGGHGKYSQGQTNNAIWLKPLYGAGLDCEFTNAVAGQAPPSLDKFAEVGGPTSQTHTRLYQIAPVDTHQPIEQLLRRAISDRRMRRLRPTS